MQVCVIKNTEPKNVNIPLVAAAGAGAGLALRHFMPVHKPEIDSVMFGESEVLKENNIKNAKKAVLSDLFKTAGKDKDNQALQLFIERTKASVKYDQAGSDKQLKAEAVKLAKAAKEKIKAAPAEVQKEVHNLTEKAVNKVRAAKILTEANIKSAVKQARPVWAYVLPGAALGALGAYVYNVIGTISED